MDDRTKTAEANIQNIALIYFCFSTIAIIILHLTYEDRPMRIGLQE